MRVPRALTLPEVAAAFQDIGRTLDNLTKDQRVDWEHRRITNASDGVSPGDYVTVRQLREAMADVTRSVGTNLPLPYFGGPTTIGLALAEGISLLSPRADHVHKVLVTSKTGLTEAADNGFLSVPVQQGSVAAGCVYYLAYASDGTEIQVESGLLVFAATNKAGTETASLIKLAMAEHQTLGTFDVDFTYTAGTDSITLNVKPTSSLTQTTLALRYAALGLAQDDLSAV